MIIEGLIEDLSNLCLSYLSEEEQIYISNEWDKYEKDNICNIAAKYGWLDLLIYARQNDYEWDDDVCSYAAENGHLEVLKWARKNGCEWNSLVCDFAAKGGHFEVLKWARENGCDLSGM